MKKDRIGKRVEIQTPRGTRFGKVVNEFTQIGGVDHNRKFVSVILAGGNLSILDDRETVCHISKIKMMD
jgi:hypothetical protein